MTDYKTDVSWNLDMAKKNAVRCAGYLENAQGGNDNDGAHVLAMARELENLILGLIDELTIQQKPTDEALENA